MRLPSIRRPSPSMAVAVMALVVASTGTSYAAGLIGSADIKNNSVSSTDIKNKTIKAADVKSGTIGAKQVKDGSLRSRDFKAGQLPTGAQGPAGPAGVGRWALVDATGAIVAQSGGFAVTAAYPTLAPAGADVTGLRANGNVYINAGENLANNGVLAVVALQNTVDQNGDAITNGRAPGADANPEFSGEISAAMCQPGVVNCAPPGTGNTNHLVVSPRNSDGTVTTDADRKRFYVVVTGDSSDRG
ncbi:hypothetical protein SFC79_05590 [Nocardioides sp. S-58]|uniref:Uncharacterized protein n=1 Tax=Nocardioides renjunii TaxID=3095075 RepID=A0ABU5K8K8_9ACTN|nr:MULTISPECIES: hypothetical protein [unclassified Nocardioides]MDZ5661232.1 hypothetical protein [Nocardioides sp. S-58]WQQ22233.1 hypothetical protein SHK17_20380 [Nocardioides sp. S-34]